MDAFEESLQTAALQEMVLPYSCEATLSQALEPSLLYHFYADTEKTQVDDDEAVEPTHIEIDSHCLDKYKGPENLARKRSESGLPDESQYDTGEASKMSRYSRVSAKHNKSIVSSLSKSPGLKGTRSTKALLAAGTNPSPLEVRSTK
jgi:hypothetical protein